MIKNQTRNRGYFPHLDNEHLTEHLYIKHCFKIKNKTRTPATIVFILDYPGDPIPYSKIRKKKYVLEKRKQNCHYLKIIIFMLYLLKSTDDFLEDSPVI